MQDVEKFGIYVHIPYCLQRCTYCDFATYEQSQIMPPADYFALLHEELRQKSASALANNPHRKKLDTVYFGGGTPSLVPAQLIVSLLQGLTRAGFSLDQSTEITLEINPATVDPGKLQMYLSAGVNRFSVGAQSFNDALLKSVHREHSAAQTRETLDLLRAHKLNYSFDLLFALPGQSLDILRSDLEEALTYRPPHISPYCLTVPEGHVLSPHRPEEETQIKMFEEIHRSLLSAGYLRYEISNYCLPGFEARHNQLYWEDQEYWGIGLSAHSFDKASGWGTRFWNPSSIGAYAELIKSNLGKSHPTLTANLPSSGFETLKIHQALTDFCHTALRTNRGLREGRFVAKFGPSLWQKILPVLSALAQQNLVAFDGTGWVLTESGMLLSNQVFGAFTFLENEVSSVGPA